MSTDTDIIKARIRDLLAHEKELIANGQHNQASTARWTIIELRLRWLDLDSSAKSDSLWYESATNAGPNAALDAARRALFEASRKLNKAHERRQSWYAKHAPPPELIQACRAADRELQRASVKYTAALIASRSGGPQDLEPVELAERVAAAVAFVED